MDSEKIAQDLLRIERHVRRGKRHISRQREIVAELELSGGETIQAKELPAQFGELKPCTSGTATACDANWTQADKLLLPPAHCNPGVS